MGKNICRISLYICIVLFHLGCGGSNESADINSEKEQNIVTGEVGNPDFIAIDPINNNDQETLVFDDLDVKIWMNGSPLSTSYEEYYSGFWRGSSCGGSGFARIGIDGADIELNLGASFIEPMFGEIDSLGDLILPSREVSWDCEECGDVRLLETQGNLDFELESGFIEFEVACSNGSGHFISSIYVDLKNGVNQPKPRNELNRIEMEAISLIGESPSCIEDQDCKLISLESDDFCKFGSLAYSVIDTDEEAIFDLQREYRANDWLAYGDRGSSLTLCAFVRSASCDQNICY